MKAKSIKGKSPEEIKSALNAELGRSIGGNLEMHNLSTCCIALKEK
jgi:hypothetical protein